MAAAPIYPSLSPAYPCDMKMCLALREPQIGPLPCAECTAESPPRWRLIGAVILLLLSVASPLNAAEWGVMGLKLGSSAQTLTPSYQRELWRLVTTVPRALWASVTTITIDGVGYDPQRMDMINCVSGTDVSAVCRHEVAHHLPVTAAQSRPWLIEWARQLIEEAGCEPSHYLRAQFPACFFVDAPQEFVASMGGWWLEHSAAIWQHAHTQWRQGNPHPANQAVLLTAWFSLAPPGDASVWATVAAFAEGPSGITVTPWQVTPWRCDSEVMIVGLDVVIRVTLDAACRVVDMTHEPVR
jgi:hypothetical protein